MSESFLGHELRGAWKSDESPTCPHNREGITGCGECIDAMTTGLESIRADRDTLREALVQIRSMSDIRVDALKAGEWMQRIAREALGEPA